MPFRNEWTPPVSCADCAVGFSLLQLLLALAMILSLALVLPTWLAVRVNQSRISRAERELHLIADAIEHFERDHGYLPVWTRAGNDGPGLDADRVDLLVGPGEIPRVTDAASVAWQSSRTDSFGSQLIDNGPGYGLHGPPEFLGWNGPYLPARPNADPWGNRYIVNIGASAIPSTEHDSEPWTVWVMSAGPNGIVETPYVQLGAEARLSGDDVGVCLRQGLAS